MFANSDFGAVCEVSIRLDNIKNAEATLRDLRNKMLVLYGSGAPQEVLVAIQERMNEWHLFVGEERRAIRSLGYDGSEA